MPSKRYDFTVADGLFPGEDVNLEWTLYERDASGAFVEVSDMTNREFTLYVLDHPRQPETEARLTVEWGAGMSVPAAPTVRAALSVALTSPIGPDEYFYRMRRTDSGNNRVCAYGLFPLLAGDELADELR